MKTTLASKVMTIANKLVGEGCKRSVAMVKVWALVKMEAVETKVAGVTQGKRQTALDRLGNYQPEEINIELQREPENQHDKNAVAVMVSVKGSRYYHMGYLPRNLAAMIAPILDKGKAVQSAFKEIRGGLDKYMNYGCWRFFLCES